jgi:glycosyltransferase involved in cell wall biosynthesis
VVVTTPVASLPEVVGAAAILVDPLDSAAIAAGIEQALARAAELRAPGLAQAARFTWEESAQALLTCYRQMLRT